MTDHIIKAAQEAGFDWTDLGVQDRLAFERFYAIAFKAGMERAAEICDEVAASWDAHHRVAGMAAKDCAESIRAEAHAQNQPENIHVGGNVSKN